MAGGKIAVVGALADALNANRVTGTEVGVLDGTHEDLAEEVCFAEPDQTSERAQPIPGRGVDQQAGLRDATRREGVDALRQRGGRVAALEFESSHQQVRERVDQDEARSDPLSQETRVDATLGAVLDDPDSI